MSKKLIVVSGALAFLALVGAGVWYLQVSKPTTTVHNNVSTTNDTVVVATYSATLSYQQGDVRVSQDDADWVKVETDAVLHEGDGVKTGENSKAIIELENGDVVRLGNLTEISFVYTNEIAVSILQKIGQTYHRVVKSQSRVYQVVSSFGSAQAIGTAFDVNVTDLSMDVNVVESTVKVKSSEEEEQIGEGKSAKLAKNATVPEVSDINSETLKNEWYAWNKEEDQKKQLDLGVLDPESTTNTSTDDEEADETPAATPTLTLSVAEETKALKLTWELTNGTAPQGFKLVRSESENPVFPGNDYQYVSSGDARTYSWEMQDGKAYHFRVCVYNGSACTVYSNDVTKTAPKEEVKEEEEETPTYTGPNLSVKAEESGVGLWWQDKSTVPGFKYYKVVRSETNSDLKYPDDSYIAVKNKGEENYRDTTAAKNTKYYYRICAVGDQVWCGQVGEVTAVTTNDVPKAVTLSATYASGAVTLTWTKSTESDFKYYKIVWSKVDATPTYPEDGYVTWLPLTTLTYTDEGEIGGSRDSVADFSTGTHYYSVCVVDQVDQVACSNTKTVKNGVVQ